MNVFTENWVKSSPEFIRSLNSSIVLRALHLFELQKHSSTLGATLWLPDPTNTDSNSIRHLWSKGKNEGAQPRKNPTRSKILREDKQKYKVAIWKQIFVENVTLLAIISGSFAVLPTRNFTKKIKWIQYNLFKIA